MRAHSVQTNCAGTGVLDRNHLFVPRGHDVQMVSIDVQIYI